MLYLFIGRQGREILPTPQYAMATNDSVRMYSTPMAMKARGIANDESAGGLKIVKTFSLSVEVQNVDVAKTKVEDELQKVNGLVDSFYSYDYGNNNLAYNYSLKIPADKIDEVIKTFKTLGIIKSENSSAMDLTEQYSDNENRLKNLYARRDRLRQMMSSKTEKLADIIAVDRELSNVQYEIENLERANRKIDGNVTYFKLDLSILPEISIDNFNNSQWRVQNSWKQAVNSLIVFGQRFIDWSFIVVLFSPVILAALLVLALFAKLFNSKK